MLGHFGGSGGVVGLLDSQPPLPPVLSPRDEYNHPATLLHHRHPRLHPGLLSDIPAEVRNPQNSGVSHLGRGEEVPGCPLVPTASRWSRPSTAKLYELGKDRNGAVPPREGIPDPPCARSVPVVLVGNKADLPCGGKGGSGGPT